MKYALCTMSADPNETKEIKMVHPSYPPRATAPNIDSIELPYNLPYNPNHTPDSNICHFCLEGNDLYSNKLCNCTSICFHIDCINEQIMVKGANNLKCLSCKTRINTIPIKKIKRGCSLKTCIKYICCKYKWANKTTILMVLNILLFCVRMYITQLMKKQVNKIAIDTNHDYILGTYVVDLVNMFDFLVVCTIYGLYCKKKIQKTWYYELMFSMSYQNMTSIIMQSVILSSYSTNGALLLLLLYFAVGLSAYSGLILIGIFLATKKILCILWKSIIGICIKVVHDRIIYHSPPSVTYQRTHTINLATITPISSFQMI